MAGRLIESYRAMFINPWFNAASHPTKHTCYRLAQQAVQTAPTTYDNLGNHNP
jgi:hypothetical protein